LLLTYCFTALLQPHLRDTARDSMGLFARQALHAHR
jgi:hypothetical protein